MALLTTLHYIWILDMAYYSGTASSYADLLTALTNACTSNGWTWADNILSKGAAFVRPYVSNGITLQGGTGKSGSSLVNPSTTQPRLGHIYNASPSLVTFPVQYFLHIWTSPDEVYLVIKFDIDRYYYLSFGMSTVADAGLWLSATSPVTYPITASHGYQMTASTGGDLSNSPEAVHFMSGFFWQTVRGNADHCPDCIWHNGSWKFDSLDAIQAAAPLVARSPSAWSSNAVLLPIQPCIAVASSKIVMVADIQKARYVRINNYEPEQIITLGSDKWKIYPFHKKNTSNPNAPYHEYHTGTFGWAIRYDGP